MFAVLLAAVRLAAPFTDGAVLQREMKVPVWGTAEAGEEVRVSFAGQEQKGTAGADGRWRVDLAPMKACCEGRELVVSSAGAAGRSGGRIVVRDVLVGEVWLCSGQSNMGIPWWGDSPRARDRMGYQIGQITSRPLLRSCFLGNGWSDTPQKDERIEWRSCTPEFLLTGDFSAVGLWYGLTLQTTLGIPVGLVGAYVGATDIETWIPDCKTPPPPRLASQNGQKPSHYHNGKVAPILPYAMRGAIWYQGESNTANSEIPKYVGRMRDLHNGWKRVFENPHFKLYFCQLCPWGDPLVPFMQEEQEKFARTEPDAGMAVLCDVGNIHDIHPNDKQTPGVRLALLALKRDYGYTRIVADSPTLRFWEVVDGKFKLTFNDVKKWFVYDPDWRHMRDPRRSVEYGFEVAGADGRWVKAEIGNFLKVSDRLCEYRGQITNTVLEVFSPQVKEPKALRYLYTSPWRGYLANEAGLPVGAFHIDVPAPVRFRVKPQAGDATMAIQGEIDRAFLAGGGIVVLGKGEWHVKSLRVRSRVTLYLESGATVRGSRNPEDYFILDADKVEPVSQALIKHEGWKWADGATNDVWARFTGSRWNNGLIRLLGAEDAAVVGEKGSVIDGCDPYDPLGEEHYRGPHGVSAIHCRRLTLKGYTIRNTGNWAHRIAETSGLLVEDVTCEAGHDGVHVRGCDRVVIRNCVMKTGDDCVAGFGNLDVLVEDCHLNTACSGFRFAGTGVTIRRCTLKGPAEYGFRGSLSRKEKIAGVPSGKAKRKNMLSFFTYFGDYEQTNRPNAGKIEIIDCTSDCTDRLLHYNFGNEQWQRYKPMTDITFRNVKATNVKLPIALWGDCKVPVRAVFKDCNVSFSVPPNEFIRGAYIESLSLENVKVSGVKGPLLRLWHAGEQKPVLKTEKVDGIVSEIAPSTARWDVSGI